MTLTKSKKTKVPVSVLIPVLNEIKNIEDCIKTVQWADEIVVIDSNSTDGTIEKAEELGARVVQFNWNGQFPKKKNWALENVDWKNEWVLILDADEHITPILAREISKVVKSDQYDGCFINRRFMFMGGWLRYCGYYPSWNLRLLKHTMGRYEKLKVSGDTKSGDNEVHEHIKMECADDRIGWLNHDMLHYAYPDIDAWVEKHNRYSNWEARVLQELHDNKDSSKLEANLFGNPLQRKRWLKNAAKKLPMRPFIRFCYHYILKKGFLDGRRGYIFCKLLAWYEFLSIVKAEELEIQKKKFKNNS